MFAHIGMYTYCFFDFIFLKVPVPTEAESIEEVPVIVPATPSTGKGKSKGKGKGKKSQTVGKALKEVRIIIGDQLLLLTAQVTQSQRFKMNIKTVKSYVTCSLSSLLGFLVVLEPFCFFFFRFSSSYHSF